MNLYGYVRNHPPLAVDRLGWDELSDLGGWTNTIPAPKGRLDRLADWLRGDPAEGKLKKDTDYRKVSEWFCKHPEHTYIESGRPPALTISNGNPALRPKANGDTFVKLTRPRLMTVDSAIAAGVYSQAGGRPDPEYNKEIDMQDGPQGTGAKGVKSPKGAPAPPPATVNGVPTPGVNGLGGALTEGANFFPGAVKGYLYGRVAFFNGRTKGRLPDGIYAKANKVEKLRITTPIFQAPFYLRKKPKSF